MIYLIVVLVVFGASLFFLEKLWFYNNKFSKRQGVNCVQSITVISRFADLFKGVSVTDRLLNTYTIFTNEKIIGILDYKKQIFFLRSPEVIQKLLKTDSHFEMFTSSSTKYDIFHQNSKKDNSILCTIFSEENIKSMTHLITNCAQQIVEFIIDDYVVNGVKPYKVDDVFTRYINDVTATCALGIESNSLKQPTNEIYETIQEFLNFQNSSQLSQFIKIKIWPKFAKLMGMKPVDNRLKEKLVQRILNTVEMRLKKGIWRSDLLQVLMELEEQSYCTKPNNLSNEILYPKVTNELITQFLELFLAEFETTSRLMVYMAYELAIHPDVQERLYKEVERTNETLKGQPLTYETIKNMEYLNMVVLEVIRKWPPVVIAEGKCIREYTFDLEGLKLTFDENDALWIPIYGLHWDPKYFPNPENFDPERFTNQNKDKVNLSAYLPLGNGLGSHLTLVEIKVLFFYLMIHFKIKVCKKTEVPFKLKKSFQSLLPKRQIELLIDIRDRKRW